MFFLRLVAGRLNNGAWWIEEDAPPFAVLPPGILVSEMDFWWLFAGLTTDAVRLDDTVWFD